MTFPQTVLPIKVEMQIGSTWTDVTTYVQRREGDGITIQRGRADESSDLNPSTLDLLLNNRDGRFSPRNPMSPYYGQIGRNTPIRVSLVGSSALNVNVTTGVYTPVPVANVSTPDAAALDIVGDIDVRFDADLDSWRDGCELVSKWTEAGNQRSYMLWIDNDGFLWLYRSPDGTTLGSAQSTVPVPITSGRLAVRATLDVDNGAGGRTTTFYTAPTLAGPWTALGSARTATPTTSIFASTATLHVGDNPNSTVATKSVRGRIYGAQVLNGIGGTVVANPDFTVQTDGATSFVDSTAKTWTLNGSVALSTSDARFYGEVTNWPQKWDITGTDVWVPLEASGILRRLGQGQPPLASTLRAGISNLSGVVAYWPLEDEDGSTQAASGLALGTPMKASGAGLPTYGSDDGFKASAPILVCNNAILTGRVSTYTTTNTIQLQFLIHIPAGGAPNNSVIARLYTSGTAVRWDLIYGTGGGLTLSPYDEDGVLIAGGGSAAFGMDGKYCRLSVEMFASGANIAWKLVKLDIGTTSVATFIGGTVNSRTVRSATRVLMNATGSMVDVALGHVEINNSIVDIYVLYQQLNAYSGEKAGRRIERLCGEQGVTFTAIGDIDDTQAMGYQLPDTFLNLVKECVTADNGILFEDRRLLGIGYRPSSALYAQPADVTLDYNLNQMASLEPVEDDQLVRNDVTVTRPGGSSARSTLASGPLSVQAPPNGVGLYDTSLTINVETDDDLTDQASWRVRLGTIDQPRYPAVDVNLANAQFTGNAALTASVRGLDSGSRLVIINPPAWIPPDDISQVVQGYTEFLSNYEHAFTFNCSPSVSNDQTGVWGDDNALVRRYSSDGSTLAAGATSTATTLSVATPSGPLWITTALVPADFPFDIIVSGERMTVTAATGTSSPQSFTVTRSVNGIVKAQSSGAAVELFTPAYYAL